MKNILVTGAAGFIGFHTTYELLNSNYKVVGLDSLNNYYDVSLKKKRVIILKNLNKNFKFIKNNLFNEKKILQILKKNNIEVIIHLAAQAGVRHSLSKPLDYVYNNILASTNLMEASRKYKKIKHFMFASTSSVYASSSKVPFDEKDSADFPLQFYAATKRSNELMAHSYSHLYQIPFTIMRFFTVYGPFGRPDMALFKFTKNITENKSIEVYNNGKHIRDFTYVTDVSSSIKKLINKIPRKMENFNVHKKVTTYSKAKFRVVNIGNGKPKQLRAYINNIEKILNKKSNKIKLPLQKGDAYKTFAKISKLKKLIKSTPRVEISSGIKLFIDWYRSFYQK